MLFNPFGKMIVRNKIFEFSRIGLELQSNRSGWTVSLFADNDLGQTCNTLHFFLPFEMFRCVQSGFASRKIVFLSKDEHDDIRILFNRTAFPQVGKLRSLVVALFDLS